MTLNEYPPIDLKEFYMFLRSKGLNENGAREIIKRLEEKRADREDHGLIKRFLEAGATN